MKDAASKLTRDNKISAGRSARKWLCSTSLVVLAVAMPSMVHAQEWTGGVSTNWNTAANWQGGAVPGAGGVASINNEGAGWPIMTGGTHSIAQVQIGTTSGGGSLTIMNGGKLNLGQDANIGLNFAGSATVTGGGSQMNVTDNLTVGYFSNGALTVSNSGHVTSRDGYLGGYETSNGLSTGIATVTSGGQLDLSNELFIGYGAGGQGHLNVTAGGSVTASLKATLGFWADSYGALNVDGATSYFSSGGFIVGRQGRGDVLATGGGKIESASAIIGEQAGSTGSVTITTGATWEVNSALTVGALGTGTLNLAGGGKLESQIATIGRNAGGVGTATVSGAGTEWTNTGALVIGRDGNGTMTLTNNAAVNSGDVTIGRENFSTGALTISNGAYWNSTGTLNVGLNGQGTMLLNHGTMLTNGANIGVGDGANGSVVLTNAGVWNAQSGTITVGGSGGSGSLTTNASALSAQKLVLAAVGPGSTANVAVEQQSAFEITNNVEIGSGSDSTGTITVSGTGAYLKVGGQMGVGYAGDGTLLIEDRGVVEVFGTSRIGFGADATGVLTVRGAGSQYKTSDRLHVGGNGSGTLIVEDGGLVKSNGAVLSQDVGSTGTALVTGSGSVWDARGANLMQVGGAGTVASLTVTDSALLQAGAVYVGGYSGAGSNVMTVSGGARVESLNAFVGGAANRSGTVLVTGAGTEWAATGNFTIGGMADGTMTVANGANVTTTSGRVLLGDQAGVSGTLTVNDASVTSAQVTWVGNNGIGTLNIGAGGYFANNQGMNIGFQTGSTGIVTVSGAGAVLAGGSPGVIVGSAGNGSLLVSNGGNVFANNLIIANSASATGTVEVTGAGSQSTSNNLVIGLAGHGDMTVADGALVTVNQRVTIGDTAGSSGTLTVNDADVTTNIVTWVGNNGVGTLNIGAGGYFGSNQGMNIGFQSGSTGTVTVSGAGAVLGGGSTGIVVGSAGTGSLLVSNGGLAYAGDLILGNATTGIGTVIVSGTGSRIEADTARVGVAGYGSLEISNGAVLNTAEGGSIGSNASLASVKVSGAGSVWNVGDPNTYELLVGGTGIGLLHVEDGGVVNGRVQIAQYGELSGNGTITGKTWMTGTSKLWGQQGQTLTFGGDLGIHTALAQINVALGTPGNATALFNVAGNLVLDGTLNVANAGGFGQGVYRIFDYGGTLTDSGLDVGVMPAGTTGTVQTAVAHQVNLLVNGYAGDTQFWNGTTTTADGTIHGGNGTWRMGPTNWTNVNGSAAAAWGSQFAVFQNNPGTVTVDNSAGAITTTGMQFMGTGWNVAGNAITLNGAGGNTTIRVGDGTGAGASHTATIASVLSGNSRLVKDDLGTLILTGANTYTGGTQINAGTLQIGNGGAGGSVTGNIVNNAALAFNHSGVKTYGDVISGTGSLSLNAGQLVLTGANTYSGGTNIASGATLRVGDGILNGSIAGNVVANGDLRFNNPGATSFGGAISGSGQITQTIGSLTLTGDSGAFTGVTRVQGGSLRVDGTLGGSDVLVSGSTLGGTGSITGTVTMQAAGILQGTQGQTLTMGGLVLASDSNVNVALGAPGNSTGLFNVTGDLTLDGTLNVSNAGGFGQGVYRIFDYGGTLTDNGLLIGSLPTGTSGTVQTAVANQVNLLVSGMTNDTQFWNGTTTVADGTVHGGAGTWRAGPTNWTDANGSSASAWGGQFAVFQNNPAAVTVDGSAGAIVTTGMQFIGTGWTVGGDAITLAGAGGNTIVRVGDGTGAGVSHTATIASVLAGNSRLIKDDLGTLILAGANTYTGGTQINNGVLQIGNGGTSGSVTGDVLNNAVLAFNRSDATTFAGAITGSGAVRLLNGDLTLTADNAYTGLTNIAAGSTLRLGNGGTTGGVAGNIDNAGTLVFNHSNAFDVAGAISGAGVIRQVGAGLTNLTGNSAAFAGTTRVENGTLAVNGTLGGAVEILGDGRLQGAGTVGNTIVSSVIAPGNSIGTLNVAGNITFNAGSIFEVEVNAAGQSDRIVATGTATINGGTVQVLAGAGAYAPSTTYTILTANGGRTGAFDGVTSNLAFLTPSLTDDANNVYLTMTRNAVSFQNVGITPNQIASGQGTESLGLGNAVYDAVLNLSADQARNAFDQLSGEIHASAVSAMVEDSRFVRNAVWDRMRATEQGTGYGVWGQAFGSWGHTDSNGNAAKMDRSIGGLFAGVDGQPFDNARFGLVAGYSQSSFDVKDRSSSGTADNYHLGLYGGTEWGAVAFRSGLAYTWHDMDTRRNIAFPGFADSLTAGYNAGTLQAFTEVGYGIDLGTAKLEPFANLAYVNFDANGFTEKGGAAALSGAGGSADTTFTTLGLRASTSFNMGETLVTAKGMLGWRHAFGDTTPSVTMNYASGSSAFSIGGVPIARDLAVVEAGLDFQFAPTATLGVTYGGQFGSGVVDQSFKANLNVKF